MCTSVLGWLHNEGESITFHRNVGTNNYKVQKRKKLIFYCKGHIDYSLSKFVFVSRNLLRVHFSVDQRDCSYFLHLQRERNISVKGLPLDCWFFERLSATCKFYVHVSSEWKNVKGRRRPNSLVSLLHRLQCPCHTSLHFVFIQVNLPCCLPVREWRVYFVSYNRPDNVS